MRNYFIYQYEDLVSSSDAKLLVTVIFIHQSRIESQSDLANEIKEFYENYGSTDKLVIIFPSYLDALSRSYFSKEEREITFVRIPGKTTKFLEESLLLYEFDSKGVIRLIEGTAPANPRFLEILLRSGSVTIFKSNGGLVESTPDHHFVFPSQKHCAKFIRTGNVLVNHSEIFFLSVQLLEFFIERKSIYCDTSSINVLPYTVFELLRRFEVKFECPTVYSFKSYEIFEQQKESFPSDSLVLISASTSGNIIDRLLKEKRAEREQICLLYFLGPIENYRRHSSNILCNLTRDEKEFLLGEIPFETNSQEKCQLCAGNSRPVSIRSDVFLTVQPRVTKHLLGVKEIFFPKTLSSFVKKFRGHSKSAAIIRTYYKENDANADYELYFDYSSLIDSVQKGQFKDYKDSLDRHIDKSIPANTKYLLHLPDSGSEKLARYIKSQIPREVTAEVLKFDTGFEKKITESTGTVVIVASCIPTGKKLLQISRLMRDHSKISLVYFVGFFRPINENYSKDLISDLGRGKDKSDERPFIAVEKMYCSIRQKDSSWSEEKRFLEEMLASLDEEKENELYNFVDERVNHLRDNKSNHGLSDHVFLPMYDGNELYLRKNFAFWPSISKYDKDDIAQSEVYFTISAIITQLENNDINSEASLKQTNYVKNLISPRNFHRFNDGIIQASLLRSGQKDHFSYDLDDEANLQMKEFLMSIIDKYNTEDGEALLEFLLAIGLKKLKLKREDQDEVLSRASKCDNPIISGFSNYIQNMKSM
jgi:hypothetical protein